MLSASWTRNILSRLKKSRTGVASVGPETQLKKIHSFALACVKDQFDLFISNASRVGSK